MAPPHAARLRQFPIFLGRQRFPTRGHETLTRLFSTFRTPEAWWLRQTSFFEYISLILATDQLKLLTFSNFLYNSFELVPGSCGSMAGRESKSNSWHRLSDFSNIGD
jgi:hypothetical protein